METGRALCEALLPVGDPLETNRLVLPCDARGFSRHYPAAVLKTSTSDASLSPHILKHAKFKEAPGYQSCSMNAICMNSFVHLSSLHSWQTNHARRQNSRTKKQWKRNLNSTMSKCINKYLKSCRIKQSGFCIFFLGNLGQWPLDWRQKSLTETDKQGKSSACLQKYRTSSLLQLYSLIMCLILWMYFTFKFCVSSERAPCQTHSDGSRHRRWMGEWL